MKLKPILLFSALALFSSCSGQSSTSDNVILETEHLTTVTGDTVSAIGNGALYIFQDRRNNYWFGSNGEGIYRYDGKYLVRFSTKHGLCNDQIRGIQQDSAGNIYFNTVNGISKYDGRTFVTLKSKSGGKWALQPGDLWFAGAQDSGVVYRYDGAILHRLEFPKTQAGEEHIAKFPRSKYPNATYSPYDVYSIYTDKKGSLWFGTNIGVCRYDGRTFAWMSEEEIGIDAIAIHVRSTIEDRNGSFWFGNIMHRFEIYANDQVVKAENRVNFKKERGIVDSKDHDAAYFMSGIEDSNGDLWTVTYSKGAWRYDGKVLRHYLIKDGDKEVKLFSIYKDRQGALWIGTHTAGPYKFNGTTFGKFRF